MLRKLLIVVLLAVLAAMVGCASTAQVTIRTNWHGVPLEVSFKQ